MTSSRIIQSLTSLQLQKEATIYKVIKLHCKIKLVAFYFILFYFPFYFSSLFSFIQTFLEQTITEQILWHSPTSKTIINLPSTTIGGFYL